MRIIIDADGSPVVRQAASIAKKKQIECIVICDTTHIFNIDGVRTITVSKGPDSVDFVLVNMLKEGDIVITQDYGLAAMCLARNAVPVSQDGVVYTNKNIDTLLMFRHTSRKIRAAGGRLGSIPKRTIEQDNNFIECLEKLTTFL